MGAVTAIAFTEKNHAIVDRLVLDSPFKTLEDVIKRVISKEVPVLAIATNIIFYFLRR